MRRRTRKSLINLVLFVSVLSIILYINRPHSRKVFAWSAIRYMTTSPILPETRGICPGLSKTSKPALVVARVSADGDPKWLNSLGDLYHLCIYTADAPLDSSSKHLQVPANRGHEAMAYLTFLIDNYDRIPEAGAVFIHGSRFAWHNDYANYDNLALLKALNVSAALQQMGYHNLRCDWSAGTCDPREVPPQGSLETSMRAMLEPWNARIASDTALPNALAILFGGDIDYKPAHIGRGDAVRAQCCAQFAVSRDSVQLHNREEYIALRQWLLDEGGDAAPKDDRVSGRIISYVWHILFLQPSGPRDDGRTAEIDLEGLNTLACPRANECYCYLYGQCDLEGCSSPGSCGQYRMPAGMKLPKDWAKTHP